MGEATSSLHIFNSLTGKKELLLPITENHIGMYVCGPTVYSNVHLGNCRTFISFDLIFRYLKHIGYSVRYVRNITDVGHLEFDEDDGEDRISKKARLDGIEPMEVVQRYTTDFHKILDAFNTLPPSIEPTATGHIVEQIEHVKKIIDRGFAYEINGSVYFDVIKFNNSTHRYGLLSGRKLEDMIHNTRELTSQSEKKSPQDFALWKKAEPKHIMRWTSPWGDGFPGWHLECTTMSSKYLGDQFDIHGGGIDLKFPHHECEIAQAKALYDKSPVKTWIHTNMLTLNGRKMAKSTGNNILPIELFDGSNELLSKPFSANVVKFFMLQAHYRSILDLSNDALVASEKGFQKIIQSIDILEKFNNYCDKTNFDIQKWKISCYEAMNDDFNTPILIANIFDAVKFINKANIGKAELSKEDSITLLKLINSFVIDIMGLQKPERGNIKNDKTEEVVSILLQLRNEARRNKDYALGDKIRDMLKEKGISINDKDNKSSFSID